MSPAPPPAPAGLTMARTAQSLGELPPALAAVPEQLAALDRRNATGRLPLQTGIRRPLVKAVSLRLDPGASGAAALAHLAPDIVVWTGEIVVPASYRLRLHLEKVDLPKNAQLWVYNARGERAGPFGSELLGPHGDIWTPSIAGPTLFLEVQLHGPRSAAFAVRELAEIVEVGAGGPIANVSAACLIDSTCVSAATDPDIQIIRQAAGQEEFITSEGAFICSGGLVADTANDLTPYLLTASHCIDTQDVASTLEVAWQYFTSSCGGVADYSDLPRSYGATLLVTGVQSDFSFLLLNSLPAGPIFSFLGWDASPLVDMALLKRVSFPCPNCPEGFPAPGNWSEQKFLSQPQLEGGYYCNSPGEEGQPLGDLAKFHYSQSDEGAIFGGSSGSPVLRPGPYIVGQLYGVCFGPGYVDACTTPTQFSIIDGAFSATYPALAPWLGPWVLDVTTGAASGSTQTAVTLSGNVDPGGTSADAYFLWGQTTAYNAMTPVQAVGAGMSTVPFTASLSGLTCATTYHYRAVAIDGSGAGVGDDKVFTTTPCTHASRFFTLDPCRVLDTRTESAYGANTPYHLTMVGSCGIPSTATAVSANITVVGATTAGYLSLLPADSPGPDTSTVSFQANQVRANNAILLLGSGSSDTFGTMRIQYGGEGSIQVLIDVNGYFQ
jgi:hypothetical protein